MSEQDMTTNVRVNALKFLSLDPLLRKAMGRSGPPEPSALLDDILSDVERGSGLGGALERYGEISAFDQKITIALHDDQELSEFVSVLRAAKTLYVIGHYLACIALCGYLGEAIAVFLIEQTQIRVRKQPLSRSAFEKVFGADPDGLSQARRLAILGVMMGVDRDLLEKANRIRKIRNKHLHPGQPRSDTMKRDASEAYGLAAELVEPFAGLAIGEDSKVRLNPTQTQYWRSLEGPEGE